MTAGTMPSAAAGIGRPFVSRVEASPRGKVR